MTVLKIIYNALVIKHCLNKVEDVNCYIEPPFPFFKFPLSCVRLCVCTCLFSLFISILLHLLTYYSSLFGLLFILFWYCFYSWHKRLQGQSSKGKYAANLQDNTHAKVWYWNHTSVSVLLQICCIISEYLYLSVLVLRLPP